MRSLRARTASPGRRTFRPSAERLESRECLSGGLMDPTFGAAGAVLSDRFPTARTLAIQADGKPVVVSDGTVARLKLDGTADTTFGGGDGEITLSVGARATYGYDVLIQPDGKILVCGQAFTNKFSANESEFFVARLTSAGALDTTFGKKGVFEWNARAGRESANGMVRLSDGSIVVAGSDDYGDGFTAFRLTAAGARMTSFGANGLFSYNFGGRGGGANAIALASNGSIVMVGGTHQGTINGPDIGAVVMITQAGRLDTGFNGTGALQASLPAGGARMTFRDVAIQGANVVVAGTYATAVPGPADGGFVPEYGIVSRYTLTGGLDPTFGAGGLFTSDTVAQNLSVRVASDNSLVIGGSHTYGLTDSGGNPLFDDNGNRLTRTEGAVAHLTAAGSLDTTFGPSGTGVAIVQLGPDYTTLQDLALAPDGRILVCGFAYPTAGQRKGVVARLTAP